MVTSPYGAGAPPLVNATCAARKALRAPCPMRSVVSSRNEAASARTQHAGGAPDDGARCTRLMRMWTPDEHSSNGDVTSMLQLYLVDRYESHGERAHIVSFDSSGWRCTRSEQCGAVAIARAEHERTEGRHDRDETDIRTGGCT